MSEPKQFKDSSYLLTFDFSCSDQSFWRTTLKHRKTKRGRKCISSFSLIEKLWIYNSQGLRPVSPWCLRLMEDQCTRRPLLEETWDRFSHITYFSLRWRVNCAPKSAASGCIRVPDVVRIFCLFWLLAGNWQCRTVLVIVTCIIISTTMCSHLDC